MNYIGLYFNIEPLIPNRDILIAELDQLGFESFIETESGLEAFIQENEFNQKVFNDLWILESGDVKISFDQKLIQDQNWNATWEASFQPIEVDDLVRIRAPFHDVRDGFKFQLLIQPQMAFGTGHHQTTWLIMREMGGMEFVGKKVLDMGCGTGILAILAEKMGASELEGVDIDQWAYENALENLSLNECTAIQIVKGGVEAVKGSVFDIILANINKNILMLQLAYYSKWIVPGGHLLLSGFFDQDAEDLIEAAGSHGFSLLHKATKEEWCMLHLIKS